MRNVRRESAVADVLDRVMENCIVVAADVRLLLACAGLNTLQGRIVVASLELWLDHDQDTGLRRHWYFQPTYDPEAV